MTSSKPPSLSATLINPTNPYFQHKPTFPIITTFKWTGTSDTTLFKTERIFFLQYLLYPVLPFCGMTIHPNGPAWTCQPGRLSSVAPCLPSSNQSLNSVEHALSQSLLYLFWRLHTYTVFTVCLHFFISRSLQWSPYWSSCHQPGPHWVRSSLSHCCSVAQLQSTLCNPMDCHARLPCLHCLLGQTHVHWVNDAIQPSYPLFPPSPALNLS